MVLEPQRYKNLNAHKKFKQIFRKLLVSGVMCLKLGLFIDTLQDNFIYSRVPIMLDSHRKLRQLMSASDATALAYEHVSLSTYISVPTA
jgi:hypothetical protein